MKSEGDHSTINNSEILINEEDKNIKEENIESLYALYDIVTTTTINVVSTNLPPNTEDKLKQVLLEKLKKSNDDPSTNNSGMFRLNIESGPLSCYYHLVGKSSLLTSNPNASEFIHVASHNALLAVLASPWEGLFELFSSEVETLFSKLQTYIDKQNFCPIEENMYKGIFWLLYLPGYYPCTCSLQLGMKSDEALLEELHSWYEVCIEYITRATKALSFGDLSVILEVALRLGEIEIQGAPEPLATDLLRFLECCSFNFLDYTPRSKDRLAIYKEKGFASSPDLSSLSQVWAKDLTSSDIPVKVRQTIECYKLKGIQDLNTLKRHMKKAGNDYYELYEACRFLSKSGYPFVLLQHVSKESDFSSEDEDIVTTLKEHLSCLTT